MGTDSKIEWTTHTFNPWRGCTKVAAGCANCYADAQAKRNPGTLGIWGDNGTRVVASEAMWGEPVKWNKAAACTCNAPLGKSNMEAFRHCPQHRPEGRPRVFCASMADVFEEWEGTTSNSRSEPMRWIGGRDPLTLDDVRRRLFAVIDATPNLDWLLLTKRPENIWRMWPTHSIERTAALWGAAGGKNAALFRHNVWLGTSIASQEDADRNIPELLKSRDLAKVLFLSIEPLLGPLEVTPYIGGNSYQCRKCGDWKRTEIEMAYVGGGSHVCVECGTLCPPGPTIDWVIVGGESGPGARPMHPGWVRSLRDQCVAAGVPFFFKQWGEWLPIDEAGPWCEGSPETSLWPGEPNCPSTLPSLMFRVGKKPAGRLLDGREWNEFPEVAHA